MWKDKSTEFECQATAYSLLKYEGYNVRGELKMCNPRTEKVTMKTKNRKRGVARKRGARFDLLIFDELNKLLLTIEVKDNPNAPLHSKKSHYEKLTGVPNIQISGMEQSLDVVKYVVIALK